MASTNKTTNYELSQFEGTDKPSWEADYNADMLSIDTNLKAVSDVADGASGSLSTLADRVTTAEGNITTNANDIDALEARADALEAGETSADGRLDALEAEQIVQNTAIEGNTQLGYNLARPYDSASTYAVGAYVLFQNTLYKCTTAVSTGEAFDPTKWLAIKATDEIAAGGYTLPIASANTLGGVKVGNNLSIDANGVLSGTNITISDTLPFTFGSFTTSGSSSGELLSQHLTNTKYISIGNYRHIYFKFQGTIQENDPMATATGSNGKTIQATFTTTENINEDIKGVCSGSISRLEGAWPSSLIFDQATLNFSGHKIYLEGVGTWLSDKQYLVECCVDFSYIVS